MKYIQLKEIYKNNDLTKYLNFFRSYTVFDTDYSIFYLEKRKFFSRVQNDYRLKYRFFVNLDISYGKIKDEKMFDNLDEAANYVWSILKKYALEKKDQYLDNIIKKYDK